jgi:hypothetical protein
MATYRSAFRLAGDDAMVEQLTVALEGLRTSGQVAEDHDHDNDGKQDH